MGKDDNWEDREWESGRLYGIPKSPFCGIYFISLKCERYTSNYFLRILFPLVTHFAVMFRCYSSKVLVLSGYISLSDSHVREGGGEVCDVKLFLFMLAGWSLAAARTSEPPS
jgi:hypothetical protein